ncbi:MAG TPA: lactate utilization protein [Pirellulales bacterium]|nr:lactate utilization protein [Pirellulales bacterium]
MNRGAFLARVREAAQAGRAFRVTQPEELAARLAAPAADSEDLPSRLAAEIDAVGGHARLAVEWNEARELLAELLDCYEPSSALCWQHPALDALGLHGLLTERNVRPINYDSLHALDAAEQRRQMLTAEIGISGVTAAVAESGTLALASSPGQERLASLAPPVHVAVVAAEQIVSDLFDLFPGVEHGGHRAAISPGDSPARLNPADLPSNWVLITGPSKTGDLELKLTTGVHGPGKWHVIIVRAPLA